MCQVGVGPGLEVEGGPWGYNVEYLPVQFYLGKMVNSRKSGSFCQIWTPPESQEFQEKVKKRGFPGLYKVI